MPYEVHHTDSEFGADEWKPLVDALERATAESSAPAVALVLPPSWGATSPNTEQLRGLNAERVVLLSSSRAQGSTERNPGFLDESVERATRDPEAMYWRRFERSVVQALAKKANPPLVTILRCCPTVGLPDSFARILQTRWLWTWMGFDPPVQLLELDQLVRVLEKLSGVDRYGHGEAAESRDVLVERFYVAPDDAIKLSRVCRHLGVRRVGIPGPLLRIGLRLSADRGLVRQYLKRPFTVSNQRLLERIGLVSLGRTLGDRPDEAEAGTSEARGTTDSFGLETRVIDRVRRWFLEPGRRWFWRAESEGVDKFPASGPAILVGIHRGFMPLDAMMFLHLIATTTGRVVRTLIHPALVRPPFLSILLPALGGRLATKANAERTLSEGLALAVYPEGAAAAMAPTRTAYPLRPFLSIEFARVAVKFGAPVVPVVAVGPAETLVVFKNWNLRWWKRLSGWPTLPVGLLFPFGPTIPLPAKWHILFLDPIYPEDIAGVDEELRAKELAERVRSAIDSRLADVLERRPSVWWGSLAAPRSETDSPTS